jgi:hypothetical protein
MSEDNAIKRCRFASRAATRGGGGGGGGGGARNRDTHALTRVIM